MKELYARLFARPGVAAELIFASLLVSVLGLSSAVFVMLVLSRYVAHGVDATLATLASGTIAAVLFEFGFRQARFRIAQGVGRARDESLGLGAYAALTGSKAQSVEAIPPGARREAVAGAEAAQTAFSAANLCAILDVPMALIFLGALFLLDIGVALIACLFVGGVLAASFLLHGALRATAKDQAAVAARRGGLIQAAIAGSDTLRAFNGQGYLRKLWRAEAETLERLRRVAAGRQNLAQSTIQVAQGLLTVAVITLGAILVVKGKFDVGALIGANILAARALSPIARLAALVQEFAKAEQALEGLRELARLPQEKTQGAALSEYKGGLEFRDLGFAFIGQPMPLFESFSLKLEPGSILVVAGGNGAGKTTLARMIVGLVEPRRGQILADGVDINQFVPEWWRKQVIYLPQEPKLLTGTLRDNIVMARPDLDDATLNRLIVASGLRKFIDQSPGGLDAPVVNNGEGMALGIRRRVALARALATGGMLAVFDEPTEGMDAEGSGTVYAAMSELSRRGVSVIAFSHDANILRGAQVVVNLDVKPTPVVLSAKTGSATPVPANQGGGAA
ncbi:MAG: ATP-binding cassette domain-containing protein [Rhodospirillales bacterium]|nr:ATP-binding cassette domain-containing protein [Rhodospirillales bacterium]MSP81244.1 ATP-binding cassette domain-containing protein [Rhodospirillales bacterium]